LGKHPTNDLRPRWISYYGHQDTIKSMSYYQALEPTLPSTYFAGKRVFIGQAPVTDPKGTKYETLATPLGEISGVEVLATTCLNFLREDWLTELSPSATTVLFVFTGFLFGYGFMLVRPWTAAGLALLALLLISGGALLLV